MQSTPTILILGSKGQVGFELRRTLNVLGKVLALDFPEIYFSKPQELKNVVLNIKPDVIINAAAYTNVDQAEKERPLALAINAEAPKILAQYCAKVAIPLIHFSTDYVFDGSKQNPYLETDPKAPINFYGETKLLGDEAIQKECPLHIILRTSWVYGTRGNNFFLKILDLARKKPELNIVNDQVGCPTSSRFLAQTTGYVLASLLNKNNSAHIEKLTGIYNCVSRSQATWFEFASYFLKADPQKFEQTIKSINPINSRDLPPTSAKRPNYSVLNVDKIETHFGLRIPSWQESLDLVLENLDNIYK